MVAAGAPTDEGTPWKPGSRFAPRKIREMSVRYAGYGPTQAQLGYYDIEEDRRYLEYERRHDRIVDCGDSDIIYTNVKQTFENITNDVRQILEAGAFPVVIARIAMSASSRARSVHTGPRMNETRPTKGRPTASAR